MEFVTSAAEAAQARGYYLVVWPYAPSRAEEMRAMSRDGLTDGVIIMEVRRDDPRVRVLDAAGIPLTMIGRADDITRMATALLGGTSRHDPPRLAGHTLIWEQGGTTLRREGDLTREWAVAIAESAVPVF